eukprot:gene935-1814_t
MVSINYREGLLKTLMSERRLPENGWDDLSIEFIVQQLALMDSNNFNNNVGAGEREGRVYSLLVSRRHYNLSHGIGRSGDIAEVQPKAAGSSLINILTSALTLHALHLAGLKSIKQCIVIPMATGMTLALCMLTLRQKNPTGKYIIWPRIDQKSCFKSILTAGFIPLIVENILNGDELTTNYEEIEKLLEQYGNEILCILCTTSCFAPRIPDKIDKISKLCSKYNTAHIINNAYGLQCRYISKLIERAIAIGRVDYIIQSTDKNFMVPVGGAIVASTSKDLIALVAKTYPGRASSSPIIDLFITLLSMGVEGLQRLWKERERLVPLLIDGLHTIAKKYHQRVLICPHNTISIALTLDFTSYTTATTDESHSSTSTSTSTSTSHKQSMTYFGSMLFQRLVSGMRVVDTGMRTKTEIETIESGTGTCTGTVDTTTATTSTSTATTCAATTNSSTTSGTPTSTSTTCINGIEFLGWGSHTVNYPHSPSYLTAACSIGMEEREITLLLSRLDKVFAEYIKQRGLVAVVAVVVPLSNDIGSRGNCLQEKGLGITDVMNNDIKLIGDDSCTKGKNNNNNEKEEDLPEELNDQIPIPVDNIDIKDDNGVMGSLSSHLNNNNNANLSEMWMKTILPNKKKL